MAQHTVPANELAIKALRCPERKARAVYHTDGHGNDGLKLFVESSGTKTWYFRARVRGTDAVSLSGAFGHLWRKVRRSLPSRHAQVRWSGR
jgi:hypothetical protein